MSVDDQHEAQAEDQPLRRDADVGREPQMIAARAGTRMYSLAALQERIEGDFLDEHREDSAALAEADTPTKRLKLILETTNYVLGVESVALGAEQKAQLIERIHANLFGYGVLDPFLLDERVTTIAIHGAEHVAVRYGHSELVNTGVTFDDEAQLRRIVGRLLRDADAELREDEPIVETGLQVRGRRVSMSIAAPPVTPYFHVDIRLHPTSAPSLDDLCAQAWLTTEAADLLRAIAKSSYGFIVVSESESGKTTLLNAILDLIPCEKMTLVERAGELRPQKSVERLLPRWGASDDESITFGQQIDRALELDSDVLVLDEIRTDEPLMILPLLAYEQTPRQIWAVRGVTDAKRLQSGMGMLARRTNMARSEEMVAAFYERLPFVVTVRNIQNRLQVFSIAEWQSRADSDYPDYVMLMQYREGAARPTGAQVARWLD